MNTTDTSPATLYARVDGEQGVVALVRSYIHYVKTLDEVKDLRVLYKEDMSRYETRMIEFLSGWLGGPALYLQRHGMPMLREHHRHYHIDENTRDQWMICMRRALQDNIQDDELRLNLEGAFWRMCDSLRR